jgi:hypothetical protein
MAQRRAPRRLARDLDRERDEQERPDRTLRSARVDDEVHGDAGSSGVEDAGEAAVVKQVGSCEQAELRQRPGDEPRQRDGDGTRAKKPSAPTSTAPARFADRCSAL